MAAAPAPPAPSSDRILALALAQALVRELAEDAFFGPIFWRAAATRTLGKPVNWHGVPSESSTPRGPRPAERFWCGAACCIGFPGLLV